jgi:hypothetical protein
VRRVKQVKRMEVRTFETSTQACSPSRVGSSFVYIEQGASRLVDAALAAAQVTQNALQFEGESLVLGVRQALRQLSSDQNWLAGVVAVTPSEERQRHSGRASLARVMLARSADAGLGSLTFVAAQDSSDELRQQLYALVQVLLEEFPRASVRVRFVA